jgi:hypothetical protein
MLWVKKSGWSGNKMLHLEVGGIVILLALIIGAILEKNK